MTLDREELAFLAYKVNADALVYLGHYCEGKLPATEVDRMNWLVALSDKLDAELQKDE